MPKPDNLPTYRVKAWWDQDATNPHFHLGWNERVLTPRERHVGLPFDAQNAVIYATADRFALWVNTNEALNFRLQVNRNYLYNDLTKAKRAHYTETTPYEPPPPYNATQATTESTDAYWARRQRELDEKANAKERARQLLGSLTDQQYATNILQGHPFYFSPEPGRTYIIDPAQKNVVRLDEAHPVGLCIYLADPEVQQNEYDWGVAIYLYLKGASAHLHKTANEYRYMRYTKWGITEDVRIEARSSEVRPSGDTAGLIQ